MVEDTLAIIRARRRSIAAEIAAFEREDAELAAAERGLARLQTQAKSLPRRAPASPQTPKPPAKRGRRPNCGDLSQRDLILDVLKRHEWLDLNGIVLAIAREHEIAAPKRTISSLLSGLKREGLVVRQRRKVRLAKAAPPRRK